MLNLLSFTKTHRQNKPLPQHKRPNNIPLHMPLAFHLRLYTLRGHALSATRTVRANGMSSRILLSGLEDSRGVSKGVLLSYGKFCAQRMVKIDALFLLSWKITNLYLQHLTPPQPIPKLMSTRNNCRVTLRSTCYSFAA